MSAQVIAVDVAFRTDQAAAAHRNAGLDALRACLTLLVVFHHCAITYGALGGWYYHEVAAGPSVESALLTLFCAINQAFFMGLFFFLAGYYTPHSLDRKGAPRFLADRFLRLGLPLLVYGFLIGPATIALARTAAGYPFDDTAGAGRCCPRVAKRAGSPIPEVRRDRRYHMRRVLPDRRPPASRAQARIDPLTAASASPHSTESAHAAERMHAAESAADGTGRERAMVKTGADRLADATMVHSVEVDDVIEVVEMVKVVEAMESIDEHEAHACADEKRRPPVPQVGIRIVRRRIP